MISKSHKFIIITPHKTASTSIVTSLKEHIEIYDVVKQSHQTFDYAEAPGHQKKYCKHKDARDYSQEILSGEYKVFCTVRNPYDRLVSWWKYTNPHVSLDTFVSQPRPATAGPVRNLTSFITINEKISVENFIRFESLQDDFDAMCDKINIPRRQLPHTNKSANDNYTEYYNDETKAFVEKTFKSDLEFFNYKFGE